MAQTIIMPKLAMGMNQGTINLWKFTPGQFVEKGQSLLDIETEKVSYEIESPGTGYLHVVVQEGEIVPVETVIAYLAETEDELSSLQGNPGVSSAIPNIEDAVEHVANEGQINCSDSSRSGRIIASPLAKKLAKINNLDLLLVSGSGPGSRIIKQDVIGAVAARKSAAIDSLVPVSTSSAETVSTPVPVSDGQGKVKATIPVRGMRKAIADSMKRSLSAAAQLSYSIEVDATEIVRLRERLLAKEEKIGQRISYLDIFALIFAKAIKKVPIVNSSLVNNEIVIWEDVNLGIAIATELNEYESGLFVPVVRDAARKSLIEISSEIKALSTKARNGDLALEDVQGGTVTISSAGFVNGLLSSTPILNPGQVLLIQPGSIVEKPVVKGGEIVARSMVTISFTFDHQVVDGIPLGKLAKIITEFMEDPESLI